MTLVKHACLSLDLVHGMHYQSTRFALLSAGYLNLKSYSSVENNRSFQLWRPYYQNFQRLDLPNSLWDHDARHAHTFYSRLCKLYLIMKGGFWYPWTSDLNWPLFLSTYFSPNLHSSAGYQDTTISHYMDGYHHQSQNHSLISKPELISFLGNQKLRWVNLCASHETKSADSNSLSLVHC